MKIELIDPPPTGRSRQTALWVKVVAALIILAHVGLVVDGARQQWITYDEFAHLPAGINYWQTGRFFIYHHNPPLIKLLAALPALAMRPTMEYGSDYRYIPGARPEWFFGHRFMRLNSERYLSFFIAARMMTVFLSGIGAIFVFIWARELFGSIPALVSLALWCFSPSILAHGQLVTPDVGATVAGLVSAYAFRRFLLLPSWPRALTAGIVLGLVELTKFTLLALYPAYAMLALVRWLRCRNRFPGQESGGVALGPLLGIAVLSLLAIGVGYGSILLPAYLVLGMVWWFGEQPGDDAQFKIPGAGFLRRCLVLAVLSLLVINAGYLFEGGIERLGEYPFQCRALTVPNLESAFPDRVNRFRGTWASTVPIPLPRHFVMGLDAQKFDNDIGLMNYLCGQYRQRGWWYYYPFALAIRTPLGTIILAASALVLCSLNRRCRLETMEEAYLSMPALAMLALIVTQDGIQYSRYLLPCLPFVCISLGRVAVPCHTLSRRAQLALIAILLSWSLVSVLKCHPHELSFFNEVVGGPSQGHRYLLETSDWGQDLTFLKSWMDRHSDAKAIVLAYASNTDPRLLGITYSLPPFAGGPEEKGPSTGSSPDRDVPVYCAVSTQILHGFDWLVKDGSGKAVELPWGAYSYFSTIEPVDRAGYSILIYKVSPNQLTRLVRDCDPNR